MRIAMLQRHHLGHVGFSSSRSTQIDDTLKPRRDRINKLAGGHLMLRRLQFLFELPARLRQCLEMDLLAQAVQYYAKARHVLERYKDMESFKGPLVSGHL